MTQPAPAPQIVKPDWDIRIDSMMGEVSEHAELLTEIASHVNAVVREDFNGDDLIARPGQTGRAVHADWCERRSTRQAADNDRVARLTGGTL